MKKNFLVGMFLILSIIAGVLMIQDVHEYITRETQTAVIEGFGWERTVYASAYVKEEDIKNQYSLNKAVLKGYRYIKNGIYEPVFDTIPMYITEVHKEDYQKQFEPGCKSVFLPPVTVNGEGKLPYWPNVYSDENLDIQKVESYYLRLKTKKGQYLYLQVDEINWLNFGLGQVINIDINIDNIVEKPFIISKERP